MSELQEQTQARYNELCGNEDKYIRAIVELEMKVALIITEVERILKHLEGVR